MSSPWSREEPGVSGQVFEFRLWAILTEQSRGALQVFLPLADRGIDGLVHRLTDDAYIPIQAKGRTTLADGNVRLLVWKDALRDDTCMLVGGQLTDGGIGSTMLVVPEKDFKRLADSSTADGRPIYTMGFPINPTPETKWFQYLVPTERVVERFGISPAAMSEAVVTEASSPWRSDLGFLGEAELVRLLAESSDLNVYRPFPDAETSELAILHEASRKVAGIQVKTVGVDRVHPSATVSILASSFKPSPSLHLVVLAWLREEGRFHEESLCLPSEAVRTVCMPGESYGHLKFEWHPDATAQELLEPYSVPRSNLRLKVEAMTAGRLPARGSSF